MNQQSLRLLGLIGVLAAMFCLPNVARAENYVLFAYVDENGVLEQQFFVDASGLASVDFRTLFLAGSGGRLVVMETPDNDPIVMGTPDNDPIVMGTPDNDPIVMGTPDNDPIVMGTPDNDPIVMGTPDNDPIVMGSPTSHQVRARQRLR
jgi:hypothetical protein